MKNKSCKLKIHEIPHIYNNDISRDTFHAAMWPVLTVAQFFGLMPLHEIRNLHSLSFRWLSLRVLFSAVYLIMGAIMTYFYMNHLTKVGITAKNLGAGLFFLFSLLCCLLFIRLASKWKCLIENWSKTEVIFLKDPYKATGMRLSLKVRVTAAVFLCLSICMSYSVISISLKLSIANLFVVEHTIYLVQTVWNFELKIEKCNWEIEDKWKQYFSNEYNYIFEFLPYNLPLSILIFWINFIYKISWSFGDVFIMIISIGLARRFQQINIRLRDICRKFNPQHTWYEIRNHYVLWCELLEDVDKFMAPLILLSCSNNLYFICFQLMNIFEKLPYMFNYVYFWFSLFFLIGRTICVFLCAASINDASKEPAQHLRSVKTSEWCEEVGRFSEQVNTELIALSGMRFFFLTRKLLLCMLGTILTYELVLLQFDKSTKKNKEGNMEPLQAFCLQ